MKNLMFLVLSVLYGSSGIQAVQIEIPKESDVILKKVEDGYQTGTAFKLKYKGKIYIITAGHVCEDFPTMEIQDKEVRVLSSRFDEVDLCILADNEEVKLPVHTPVTDFNKDFNQLKLDAYSYNAVMGVFVRDIYFGRAYVAYGPEFRSREALCDPRTECISFEYHTYRVSTDIRTVKGNSGGPVIDVASKEVLGVMILTNTNSLGLFTPIDLVLKEIDGTLVKPVTINAEWELFGKTGDSWCKKHGIETKPLIARTGYKSFNIFCRKP